VPISVHPCSVLAGVSDVARLIRWAVQRPSELGDQRGS